MAGRHQRAAAGIAAVEGVHLAEDPLHAAVRGAVEAVPVDVDVVREHLPRFPFRVPLVVQQQVDQERGDGKHRPQVVAAEGIHRPPLVVVAEHPDQLGTGRQRAPVVLLVQMIDLAHRGNALGDPLADLEQRGVVGDDADPAEVLLPSPVRLRQMEIEPLAGAVGGPLQLPHQQVVQRTGDQIAARRVEEPRGDEVVVLALVDHDGAFHLVLVRAPAGGKHRGVVALHHDRQGVGDVAAHPVDVEPLQQGAQRVGEPFPHRQPAVVEQHAVAPAPVAAVGGGARHQVAGVVEAFHQQRLGHVVDAAVEVRDQIHQHLHLQLVGGGHQGAQAVVAAQARLHLHQALRRERRW